MAKSFACLTLFVLLILSNQVFHAKGRRNLVARRSLKDEKVSYDNVGSRRFRLFENNVDSFRPTTPSHSPGMGHSKHD
ncbi:hypothetical protein CDL12_16072 [Handroanthus impetiginosus]|uniref:Uncharacterized protein n=1 Tax=Handroanthus impetiginosus TaxID=429701 RepID=A0A2G9H1D4_9LAMI|nr:hypothetical protein CDL12_16072 [Handroanthus impetiginosus]